MRVQIPPATFGTYCAEITLAEVAESRAAEQRRQLERRDLADDDRVFLAAQAERNAVLAKALRGQAEGRLSEEPSSVVQIGRRA